MRLLIWWTLCIGKSTARKIGIGNWGNHVVWPSSWFLKLVDVLASAQPSSLESLYLNIVIVNVQFLHGTWLRLALRPIWLRKIDLIINWGVTVLIELVILQSGVSIPHLHQLVCPFIIVAGRRRSCMSFSRLVLGQCSWMAYWSCIAAPIWGNAPSLHQTVHVWQVSWDVSASALDLRGFKDLRSILICLSSRVYLVIVPRDDIFSWSRFERQLETYLDLSLGDQVAIDSLAVPLVISCALFYEIRAIELSDQAREDHHSVTEVLDVVGEFSVSTIDLVVEAQVFLFLDVLIVILFW